MSRKQSTFIATHGRDEGKHFLITEKDAFSAEKWAMRVTMAAMAAGVEVPDKSELQGAGGLISLALNLLARVKWETAEPLLDEMMQCVEFIPDPLKPFVKNAFLSTAIEEVQTIVELRREIIALHTDFFTRAETLTTGE